MDCIFCKIIKGEIPSYKVWENKNFLVFLDIMPLNIGHLLIIPKKHVEEVYDMEDEQIAECFNIAKKLSVPLRKVTSFKKVGIVVEGFGVPHAHVHLVPINKGNEINPERAKKIDEQYLKQTQSLLSEVFKDIK